MTGNGSVKRIQSEFAAASKATELLSKNKS